MTSRMACYLKNRNGKLNRYELEVSAEHLKIISLSNRTKCTLETRNVHPRKIPKQKIEQKATAGDSKEVAESAAAAQKSNEEVDAMKFWYPIKFAISGGNKFRLLFADSSMQRQSIIDEVLKV